MPTIEEILRARKQQELLEKAKEQASSRERLLGSEDELWRWITDQFRLLPRRQRDCYARLWDERLLSCGDKHATPRSIADYSTRLLTSAVQTKKRLLVVLPEDDETTSSMIVATSIVLHSLDRKYCPRNRLLYICHQPGMRRVLCDSQVRGLDLSSVFPQSVVRGDLVKTSDCPRWSTRPELVCACRPSRPGKLIYDFPPDVILIDMTGHEPLPWLPEVVTAVRESNIPAVAWGNDFLACEISAFRDAGWAVFRWSPHAGPSDTNEQRSLRAYVTADWHTEILASIIASPAGSPGELMASAANMLFRLRGEETRPIIRDAITLLNRALKALTRLAVPLERYEEESKYFWGLYPIRELLAGAERFVEATRVVGLPGEAEKALDLLKAAYDLYKEEDPPLWTALSRILTALEGNERLVICPNASLCRLFSETLAGYLGLSAEDLRELGISFSWPKDLRPGRYGKCMPLIVGAPGSYDWPRLSPLYGAEQIEVLMYPHEFPLLRYSVREISAKAAIDVNENLVSLASLVDKKPPHFDREPSQAMSLAAPKLIALDGQDSAETQVDQYQLLPDLDSAAEWEALLPRDYSEEMADLGVLDADGSAIADRAIKITFDGGHLIYFEHDDVIQAVVNGALAEQTAGSVSPGDQVLIIDGQRRQSLYSLILGRLHDHPAVRIHLNLMERWWEEIEAAYIRKWHGFGKSDWSLLQEIRSRGSTITTVQTIQNWVRCVHCPEDSGDMGRIAEALDMAFSKANYRLIHKGAQRVHVLHRNISRRLNTWLQQQLEGYGSADEVLDGIVDDDLQLTLRDFQDSVVLLGVRTVEAVGNPILRSRLGILLRGDQQ